MYAPEKTFSLLQGAEQMARHPMGEFVAEIAKQLKSAADHIEEQEQELRKARMDTSLATKSLKIEEDAHRQTSKKLEAREAVLLQIAEGEKNPKKLAKDTLYPPKVKPIDAPQQPVPVN